MITIERCKCGFKNRQGELACRTYWLKGIGHFTQGSGFTKEQAQNIADLLNKQADEQRASDAALHKPAHGGRCEKA